ncbi:helix-turn-helix domain-containing protein [Patescibacteria group bacterium]|nr:helix-turn-helix domain-containing protein [Patescibacteria group bacterium]MBU4016962.1 helix-turn-helix domain-containing protein [Patescibacteria group bacterium]MBU4098435.1 helix-turn-helix domain-containing protein [Patescibacteria group bacterium]
MQNKLISIGKTAKILGVSIDTLRRWDLAGRLQPTRSGPRGHRFYLQSDIEQFLQDIDAIAKQWAQSPQAFEPKSEMYCQTRDVFQARLEQFQSKLGRISSLPTVSLITAIAGEIGNNSFDHNLGNWPDIPGIFFFFDIRSRKVVLADRGQGILTTLKRVRPELSGADEALKVAFTETISGRYPETRGNGLKFVRSIIITNPFTLYFQTGDAYLNLKEYDKDINVQQAEVSLKGCFASIGFEGLI